MLLAPPPWGKKSSSWAEEPVRSRHILRTRPLGWSARNPSLHNHRRRRRRREGGRGPGLQIIPEKGFKRYPSLSLLLNQPLPSLSVFESFPSNSLSLFLAEDKQRNSRTSVCLYSSNVIVLSSAEGKDFFITCLNIPSAAVWHAQQQLLCVIVHTKWSFYQHLIKKIYWKSLWSKNVFDTLNKFLLKKNSMNYKKVKWDGSLLNFWFC